MWGWSIEHVWQQIQGCCILFVVKPKDMCALPVFHETIIVLKLQRTMI